jgi:hypothetical protein
MAHCTNCGSLLTGEGQFCTNCGSRQPQVPDQPGTEPASHDSTANPTVSTDPPSTTPLPISTSTLGTAGRRPWQGELPTRRLIAYAVLAGLLVVGIFVGTAVRSHAFAGTPAALDQAAHANSLLRKQESQRQAEEARRREAYQACATGVDPLVVSLKQLDTDLGVGLNYSDYGSEVRDANRAYQTVIDGGLAGACLSEVGVPLENALNDYISADNTWNNCISNLYCSNNSITPTLRAKWAKATIAIQRAEAALSLLRVGIGPTGGSTI